MKLLKILSFIAILLSCNRQESHFLNDVVSDFALNSYYLYIDISDAKESKSIVVENLELYNIILDEQKLNPDEYKELILNNDKLNKKTHINHLDLFIPVAISKDIANKNKQELFEYFFTQEKVLKSEHLDRQNQIIAACFKMNVKCKIDDYSGNLICEF